MIRMLMTAAKFTAAQAAIQKTAKAAASPERLRKAAECIRSATAAAARAGVRVAEGLERAAAGREQVGPAGGDHA